MAAVSPLAKYKDLAASFNITSDKSLPTDVQLVYAREQVVQITQIINRLLFDLTTTNLLMDSAKDDATISSYQSKINQYGAELRQHSHALDIMIPHLKELENAVASETE